MRLTFSLTFISFFQFVLLSALVVCAYAGGYGGGYGGGNGGGYGGGGNGNAGRTVPIAIQSRHQVEFRDVPSTGEVNPTTIEVGAK